MSSALPGSCAPNWLHGIPTTEKPCSPKRSYRFSRPSYCGVRPQNDATLTSSVTLPFWSASTPASPSIEVIGTSYTDICGPFRECLRSPYGRRVRNRTVTSSPVEELLEQFDASQL